MYLLRSFYIGKHLLALRFLSSISKVVRGKVDVLDSERNKVTKYISEVRICVTSSGKLSPIQKGLRASWKDSILCSFAFGILNRE